MTTEQAVELLKQGRNDIIGKIIHDLISEKADKDELYKKLYLEYKGEVPILKKERPVSIPDYKALNRIPAGLRGLFVLQGATFTIGKNSKVNSEDSKTLEVVNEFRKTNLLHQKDLELITLGGICGVSARMLYVDENAEIKVKALPAWEYIVIDDANTKNTRYALHYYEVTEIDTVNADDKGTKVTYVEFYDSQFLYNFKIVESEIHYVDEKEHFFDAVPIIQYENNKKQGDFYEERPLIEAYENGLSIEQDELEDLRTSYMVFRGTSPTEEQMRNAKFTGAFGSDDPEFDVKYLEKMANAERTKLHLDRLRKDAFTSASRIDFRDDKQSAKSGYARLLELQTLEDDCSLKRMEIQRVSSIMYYVLSTALEKLRNPIKWETIETEYRNNLPIDLEYYGTFVQQTFGKLPLLNIYEQLPFIKNAQETVDLFNEESAGMLDVGMG